MTFIDPATIKPSIEDMAGHIRTRTLNKVGKEMGTFTEDVDGVNITRPNAAQAQGKIDESARFVALKLGKPTTEWTGDLEAVAKDVVGVYAALKIERSFYARGSDPDSTGSDQLGAMFREQLQALLDTAQNNQVGGARYHTIVQIGADQVGVAGIDPTVPAT